MSTKRICVTFLYRAWFSFNVVWLFVYFCSYATYMNGYIDELSAYSSKALLKRYQSPAKNYIYLHFESIQRPHIPSSKKIAAVVLAIFAFVMIIADVGSKDKTTVDGLDNCVVDKVVFHILYLNFHLILLLINKQVFFYQ